MRTRQPSYLVRRAVRTTIIVAATVVGAAMPIHAQDEDRATLHGIVRESMSGDPIPGVRVEVDGTALGAVTDSAGAFRLRGVESGPQTIVFYRIGYARMELTLAEVDADDLIIVAMVAQPVVLEGLAVEVNRLDRRLRAIPYSTSVFEEEELLRSAVDNPLTFVRHRFPLAIVPCRRDRWRDCILWRGQTISPAIYVDEVRLIGGLEDFRMYSVQEFYRIEVIRRGQMIRAYTHPYMTWLARSGATAMPIWIR